MPELGFPDRHHVHAAEGWLELGDSAEAARELRQVSRPGLAHPDALEVQWRLHAARGQWDAALDVARSMTRTAPERAAGWMHAGYCLHELRRTDEAWEMLSAQADRSPSETIIAYNLACYACQLGRATDAALSDWATDLDGRMPGSSLRPSCGLAGTRSRCPRLALARAVVPKHLIDEVLPRHPTAHQPGRPTSLLQTTKLRPGTSPFQPASPAFSNILYKLTLRST